MNNNLPAIPCKVVLLGESGVGKTSIISRYVNNTFHSNFIPTMGSCYATKTVPFIDLEKSLKFEVKFN
jgi:GTPase SAR1 family protein